MNTACLPLRTALSRNCNLHMKGMAMWSTSLNQKCSYAMYNMGNYCTQQVFSYKAIIDTSPLLCYFSTVLKKQYFLFLCSASKIKNYHTPIPPHLEKMEKPLVYHISNTHINYSPSYIKVAASEVVIDLTLFGSHSSSSHLGSSQMCEFRILTKKLWWLENSENLSALNFKSG